MLKRIALFLCTVICCANVWSAAEEPDIEKDYQPFVERFIDCVKNNKVEELSKMISYPLDRPYPVPAIVSADDFIKRYHQIFDEELIKTITELDITKDWEADLWRGIMLKSGLIWLNYDGKLTWINYISECENDLRKKLIEEQGAKLHQSLQKFKFPFLEGKTEKFLIRVDGMDDGYRYAAWSLPKKWSDKPDIIIYKGQDMENRGLLDLPTCIFKTGPYTYRIDLNKPESEFKVSRGKERILQQSFVECCYDHEELNRYLFPHYLVFPDEPDIEKDYQPFVERFIDCVKNNKVEELAKMMHYPLDRYYPIPAIASQDDFIKRYKQIFDEKLIKEISESDMLKDWHTVGWRGTMLHCGTIWIDEEGKVYGILHTSQYEEDLSQKLIEEGRRKIHPSLRKFQRPEFEVKTDKFLIRVDVIGDNVYRYAAWSLPKQWSDEPDIVINNGRVEVQGTAHLTSYWFKNGDYIYLLDFGHPQQRELFGTLEVFKGEKRIVCQEIVPICQ